MNFLSSGRFRNKSDTGLMLGLVTPESRAVLLSPLQQLDYIYISDIFAFIFQHTIISVDHCTGLVDEQIIYRIPLPNESENF